MALGSGLLLIGIRPISEPNSEAWRGTCPAKFNSLGFAGRPTVLRRSVVQLVSSNDWAMQGLDVA
jgi:hypothetical protein